MNIRFYNARILPMETADGTVLTGELWVKDDRITLVVDPTGREKHVSSFGADGVELMLIR